MLGGMRSVSPADMNLGLWGHLRTLTCLNSMYLWVQWVTGPHALRHLEPVDVRTGDQAHSTATCNLVLARTLSTGCPPWQRLPTRRSF